MAKNVRISGRVLSVQKVSVAGVDVTPIGIDADGKYSPYTVIRGGDGNDALVDDSGRLYTIKSIGLANIATTSLIYGAEIIQNDYATEDILLHESSSLFTIKHVVIWSQVALNYRLHFFGNDKFNDTFDNSSYIGYVDLDLTTYGAQIAGAGTYYMDVSGLNIEGIDMDNSGEMHIALQNLSAATKQTTDKVMLNIYYEPRNPMNGM